MSRYQVIYADPPWPEGPKGGSKFWAGVKDSGQHYQLMTLEEIKSLPVPTIVDPRGCVLFLWCPYRHAIKLMPSVLTAWGFTFKTIGFVWVKVTKDREKLCFGPGFYTGSNTEPCWIATSGRVPIPDDGGVQQVVFAPRGRHSEKPVEVIKRIDRLYPTLRGIELFARSRMKGWDVWGNEVRSDVKLGV